MRETSSIRAIAGALIVGALLVGRAEAQAPASAARTANTASLGTVKLTQAAMADGKPLPAGTYTLRVSSEAVAPVVGQGPDAAKWVEFLQGGQVKGRELASVVAPGDVKEVAKRTPPAAGTSLVHTLKGADYLRIWVSERGAQYLIHLATPGSK